MNFKKRDKTEHIIVYHYPTDKRTIGKREIDRHSRAAGGFGIGYHFVIRRDGVVEEGRHVSVIGAHNEDYNHNSIAVCLVDTEHTTKQLESYQSLLDELQALYPNATVLDHGPSEP
jgi:N-acetylmuramoyl-L-alanine amidase